MGYKMKRPTFFTGKDNGGCHRVSSPFKQTETKTYTKAELDAMTAENKALQQDILGTTLTSNKASAERKAADIKLAQEQDDLVGDLKINPETGFYDEVKPKMEYKDGKFVTNITEQ